PTLQWSPALRRCREDQNAASEDLIASDLLGAAEDNASPLAGGDGWHVRDLVGLPLYWATRPRRSPNWCSRQMERHWSQGMQTHVSSSGLWLRYSAGIVFCFSTITGMPVSGLLVDRQCAPVVLLPGHSYSPINPSR